MIKDNVLYFGYGDIAVGHTYNGYITFRGFKPPTEVGGHLPENYEWLTDEIKIWHDDILKFIYTDVENQRIAVGNYMFDFTNYNPKSVGVIIKQINSFLRCLAC